MKYELNNETDRNRFFSRLDELLSRKCTVELKEVKKSRTLSQNAYLHVCITLFAIEFGYHMEDAKHLLKRNCTFMHTYDDNDILRTKRTRDLDTKQMTDFIDYIRTYAGMQGCYIPTPEEYIENRIHIDNEINRNKEYL